MVKALLENAVELWCHRLYQPAHARACLRRRRPTNIGLRYDAVEEHLRGALEWLRRAYRATGEKGVAARYTFMEGWLSPYPETTGYIIPTLFHYSGYAGDSQYRDIAFSLGEWLLSLQLESGAFPGGHLDQGCGPVVFNTGQILIGLLSVYRESGKERFMEACLRTGQWLTEVQDRDGAWRRFTYKDRFHAYHTRVAWPLIDLGLLAGEPAFVAAGRANLEFSLTLQEENGWFRRNTLDQEEVPFTHTLAYVARGLLEAGELLGEERYVERAKRLSLVLLTDLEERGFLAGQYDRNLSPIGSFSCLTGNAQTAVIWLKLARRAGEEERRRFQEGARTLNRQVMHCQDLYTDHPGLRGAVPGSWPLWGSYIRFGYPNWAAKFLADALLLELERVP